MDSEKRIFLTGAFYTAVAKYGNIILAIFIGAVLARLLSPEEFGVVAIVTVFVLFFNMMSDFGLGPAIIQNQALKNSDIESIFSFSIVLSFFFSCLFFSLSTVISNFFEMQELKDVTKILSLAILFYSLQAVPKAIGLKNLKFKQIGLITIVIQVISGTLAIFLAYRGFSYYSLVIKSVVDSFLTFVAFYILSPVKVSGKIKKSSILKISNFSIFNFLFNFINYFSRHADNLLIGKYFGPVSLGYYDKSYRLMMMPVQNLTHVISPVLLPVLSKYSDDNNRIYSSYLKVVKILAYIGFPLSVLLFFSANEIILIIYGSQWGESVPVFKLLSLTVGIQMVMSSSGAIFQAIGKTKLMFISGLISAVFMVGAISYGVFMGKNLEAVSTSLILTFTINFFQVFYFLIVTGLKKSIFNFLKALRIPLFMSGVIAVFIYLSQLVNISNIYLSFFRNIIVFAIIYFITFISFKNNRDLFLQYLNKFRMKYGK